MSRPVHSSSAPSRQPHALTNCSLNTSFSLVKIASVSAAGTAYVHGLQYVTGDFVILMDADLSHHVRRLHLSRAC